MTLLAFPCDADIAAHFLQRIDTVGAEALLLEKQRLGLERLLAIAGVQSVHILQEPFYGRITCAKSAQVLERLACRGVERALFPLNDFCGNVALQLSAVTDHVAAVNATSVDPVVIELEPISEQAEAVLPYGIGSVEAVQQEIVRLLQGSVSREGSDGVGTGERPTTGLLHNSPYDTEVLFRYVHAASVATGRVLEVGCGLGYGSLAVKMLNPGVEVTAIDYDPGSIEFARRHLNHGRVTYEVAHGEGLPFPEASFDTVICYEVVEHVADPGALIAEIRRVLRRGGMLVGSTPNHRLYAYRVNRARGAESHDALRRAGVWPWHLHELDERSIGVLLEDHGFIPGRYIYPTYVKGLDLRRQMQGMNPRARLALLAAQEGSSAADFGATRRYCPLWSGYSFVFEAIKE